MRNLNRMIIKAENISSSLGLRFAIGWVDITAKGSWVAVSQLWNGVQGGKLTEFISYHPTMQEAVKAVESLAAQYYGGDNPTIIVDNAPREGDYGREEKTVDVESINSNGSTQDTFQNY